MSTPYRQTQTEDATTFSVSPEPHTVGGTLMLMFQGTFCALFMTGCTAASIGMGGGEGFLAFVVGAVIFGAAFYVPYKRVQRQRLSNEEERAPTQITLTNSALSAGPAGEPARVRIDYAALHRFVLRNKLDGTIVSTGPGPTVVAGGSGVIGAASALTTGALSLAANMEQARMARKLAGHQAISFQLIAEAQGLAHVLAQGMTEAAANGLMHDVSRAMDTRMAGAGTSARH